VDTQAGERILQRMVEAVFVKFTNAEWQLPGTDEPGVYPVKPQKSDWYLDRNRKSRKLRVVRCQIPLLPAFAKTAHSAQGANEDDVFVDVCLSAESSPQTCYVAMSRVKRRDTIWILRPFEASMFNRRELLGPPLLLKRLKGEAIDWQQVAARLRQDGQGGDAFECPACSRACALTTLSVFPAEGDRFCSECRNLYCTGCCTMKAAVNFDLKNIRAEELRLCKECAAAQSKPAACQKCGHLKSRQQFKKSALVTDEPLVCLSCEPYRTFLCVECGEEKAVQAARPSEAHLPRQLLCWQCSSASAVRKCSHCLKDFHHRLFSATQLMSKSRRKCPACVMICSDQKKDSFTCSTCGQQKSRDDFSDHQRKLGLKRTCRICVSSVRCAGCQLRMETQLFTSHQLQLGELKRCRNCVAKKVQPNPRQKDDENPSQLADFHWCSSCGQSRPREAFSSESLTQGGDLSCMSCKKVCATCSTCGRQRPRDDFSDHQWKLGLKRTCRICVSSVRCAGCQLRMETQFFTTHQLQLGELKRCRNCVAKKVQPSRRQKNEEDPLQQAGFHWCSSCGQPRPRQAFSAETLAQGDAKKCDTCLEAQNLSPGLLKCHACHKELPRNHFSGRQLAKTALRRCLQCSDQGVPATLQCRFCELFKSRDHFTVAVWEASADATLCCNDGACQRQFQAQATKLTMAQEESDEIRCEGCRRFLSPEEFDRSEVKKALSRCRSCLQHLPKLNIRGLPSGC
jgi:hypothetical protein